MVSPRYSVIIHSARKKMGLSVMEYLLADSIHKLSRYKGWSNANKKYLAEFLGTSERSVYRGIGVLINKKLVEIGKNKYLKTTILWHEATNVKDEVDSAKMAEGFCQNGKNSCQSGKKSRQSGSQSVNNNINNNIYKDGSETPSSKSVIKQKKNPPNEHSVQTKPLLLDYCGKYRQKLGLEYVINWAKDGSIIKRLVSTLGEEKVKGLMDKFFKLDTDFVKNAGYSVGVFSSQIPRLQSSDVKPKWKMP